MLGPKTPILRLCDRAVELIAPDGTVRASVRHDKPATDEARLAAWRTSLAAVVAEHHLAGARVTIAYTSATGVSSVVTLPAGLASGERRSGALLNLAESLTLDLDASPHDAIDVRAGGASRLMLAAADQAGIVAEVYQLATAAGLRVERLVPDAAFEAARALAASCGGQERGQASVSLWVGDASSVLVATQGGAVTMVRAVPVGVWTLLDALERPFTAKSSGAQVTLDAMEAGRVLREHGVPGVNAKGQVRDGVIVQDLAPALVPIVRRLALDTKQTIRFGIAAELRAECSCVVLGPGAGIPGLVSTVGDAAGVTNCTLAAEAPRAGVGFPTLLPKPEQERRDERRGRGLLWAGVALAAIAVGVEGLQAQRDADVIERLSESLSADVEDDAGDASALSPLREAVNDTLARVRTVLPNRAPWPGVLAAIAREAPAQVRVSRIELSQDAEGATCAIQGTCLRPEGGVAPLLGEFARRLGALPVVETVRLGEVTSESDGADFSLDLRIRLVPMRLAGDTAAQGDTP